MQPGDCKTKKEAMSPEFRTDPPRSKVFQWGQLDSGNCHQINGTLTITDDGWGRFECITWTDQTHTGDSWNHNFRIMDSQGVRMFDTWEQSGPRMDDGSPPPRYRWQTSFGYDKSVFDRIAQAVQFYSC